MAIPTRKEPGTEVKKTVRWACDFESGNLLKQTKHKSLNCLSCAHPGQQGEAANSFLAILASSSSEEMEAELQERVESSQKQANHVVELYERLKSAVDQMKTELNSGVGEIKHET